MTYGWIHICASPINHASPHFTVFLRMAIIGYLTSEHLLSRRHINDAAATGGRMWRDVSTPPWRSTSITCFSSRQISALRDVTEQRVRHIDVSFTSDVFFWSPKLLRIAFMRAADHFYVQPVFYYTKRWCWIEICYAWTEWVRLCCVWAEWVRLCCVWTEWVRLCCTWTEWWEICDLLQILELRHDL